MWPHWTQGREGSLGGWICIDITHYKDRKIETASLDGVMVEEFQFLLRSFCLLSFLFLKGTDVTFMIRKSKLQCFKHAWLRSSDLLLLAAWGLLGWSSGFSLLLGLCSKLQRAGDALQLRRTASHVAASLAMEHRLQALRCPALVASQPLGSSWTRNWTHVSCTGRWILHHWATRLFEGWSRKLTSKSVTGKSGRCSDPGKVTRWCPRAEESEMLWLSWVFPILTDDHTSLYCCYYYCLILTREVQGIISHT